MAVKKILIITGSASDLKQTKTGLAYLKQKYNEKFSHYVKMHVASCHRNLWELQQICFTTDADVIIAGAGLAAALPGITDAVVNGLLKKGIPIIGVAFSADPSSHDAEKKNMAAELSITCLPETPVRYAGLGSEGFLEAVKFAVEGHLNKPETVSSKRKMPLLDIDLSHFLEHGDPKTVVHQFGI